VGEAPANRPRSTGGPATTVTGMRGRRFTLLVRGSNIFSGPHIAMGITGAPVARASRAAPVLPRIGHRSASRVVVPSG
jgi:hypothetical protein